MVVRLKEMIKTRIQRIPGRGRGIYKHPAVLECGRYTSLTPRGCQGLCGSETGVGSKQQEPVEARACPYKYPRIIELRLSSKTETENTARN